MEFCNGWCSQLDGQRSFWDGPSPSLGEDLAQLGEVTLPTAAGDVSEDELFAERFQVLARL